eukprot:CAMPEP_0195307038 /NCGR_PEP_ID=MMETSP0707-20130614/37511_1 /TAXON_ID=33640 /ORGANISM="Asterionellopsis glacialis, Strain CCMP134" /LENGTH=55 /DNA_ID=CAMNT_0040371277 /DNA_START=1831 /DNA_END=1998 /DNA_ORIENTATION=-
MSMVNVTTMIILEIFLAFEDFFMDISYNGFTKMIKAIAGHSKVLPKLPFGKQIFQ